MVIAVLGVKKNTLVSAPLNKPRNPYLRCNLVSASSSPVYISSADDADDAALVAVVVVVVKEAEVPVIVGLAPELALLFITFGIVVVA